MQQLPDWLQWVMAASAIFTPFAVFFLRGSAEGRRRLTQGLEDELTEVKKELRNIQVECREDIRAIITQLGEYPRRQELQNTLRDLREDFSRRDRDRSQ